jgi:hypothetical protein
VGRKPLTACHFAMPRAQNKKVDDFQNCGELEQKDCGEIWAT